MQKHFKIFLFLAPLILFTLGISYIGTDAIVDYV